MHDLITLHAELGIAPDYAQCRQLDYHADACHLVPLGLDIYGRDQFALEATARAWQAMREAAALAGIPLQLVSAFRSSAYQAGLIRRKLAQGQCLDDILKVSAAPGYSEHHTGRALDLCTPDYPILEAEFAHSPAFVWLQTHAGEFGFVMSYPPTHPSGIAFEPWHWCFQET